MEILAGIGIMAWTVVVLVVVSLFRFVGGPDWVISPTKRDAAQRVARVPLVHRPAPREGFKRTTLWVEGRYWAVTGHVAVAPDHPPAFIATDVRQLMVDGSETVDMLHNLAPALVVRIERMAADSLWRAA
ncbi:hypothetical protein Tamer19_17550 [Cupriavidus sp. TA19]|uniref:hypothetical protein n=1 Tax=Cupriavidus sp. TA19 TaxID=701108 RepID=UPI00272942A1|nr:hypothetical protein [Cupriavidus sp. TA19]GLC92347.1 hypothetical protein Tamer19_17550 [Cupriavidus sp. TA19]